MILKVRNHNDDPNLLVVEYYGAVEDSICVARNGSVEQAVNDIVVMIGTASARESLENQNV